MKFWAAGTAALLLFLVLAPAVSAQISVSGGLTRRFQATPGEEVQGRIIVHNAAGEPRVAKVYLTDYQSFADGKVQYGTAGEMPRSNASWVHVVPAEQVVPAGGTAAFHFIVRIPGDLTLTGTFWSMLMVEPVAPETLAPPPPGKDRAHVGIRTITRTGVHIVTHILDTGRRDMRFASRQVTWKDGELFLDLDIENSGERLLGLTVWAELFDEKGISMGRFHAGRRGLYPGGSMRMQVPLAGVVPGTYQALVVADNGDDHVFGARYEIEVPSPPGRAAAP